MFERGQPSLPKIKKVARLYCSDELPLVKYLGVCEARLLPETVKAYLYKEIKIPLFSP